MAELKVIKLLSGDDIIGIVETNLKNIDPNTTETDDSFPILFLRAPKQILREFVQDELVKKHYIQLIDWIPETNDLIIPIPKDLIITIVSPNDELMNYYYSLVIDQIDDDVKLKDKELAKLLNHNFDDEDIQ